MINPVSSSLSCDVLLNTVGRNHILIFCDGGLANRVNSLLGGLAIAAKMKRGFTILWPRNNRCGAAFSEIFVPFCDVMEIRLQDLVPHEDEVDLWLHENDVGFRGSIRRLRHLDADSAASLMAEPVPRSILYCENSLPGWLTFDEVAEQLRNLRVQSALVQRARDTIEQNTQKHPYIGIHLRATDFTSAPPTEAMYQAVTKQRSTRFFICSDDPEIEAKFASEPNVFVHTKTHYVSKRTEGAWRANTTDSDGLPYTSNIERSGQSVQEATIDLLLLAASVPVQTSNSSFLALAERLRKTGWIFEIIPSAPRGLPHTLGSGTPPLTVTQAQVLSTLALLKPWRMEKESKVRIGGDADGGYVMPQFALRADAVISIGIGDQVSFDLDLANRGAVVYQYDHTIQAAPVEHENFRFHRAGWGPVDNGPLLSLASMIKQVDWTGVKCSILKFDTEGAEWDSLKDVASSDLARFDVIAGEFHGLHNLNIPSEFKRIRTVLEKIALTHTAIHLHANNATGIRLVLGVPVPPLLEITYIKKGSTSLGGYCSDPIPSTLDRPNMKDRPDIVLRPF